MRALSSVLFAALLWTVNASAQTSSTVSLPPDIEVLQKEWRLEVRNPLLDTDPFSANGDFNASSRAQRVSDAQNADRARGSESRQAPPQRTLRSSRSVVAYVYRAKIKNTGAKTIRLVDWGYVFNDPNTQEELGRHRRTSKVKIRPGQSKDLVEDSPTPPTSIVNANSAGKKSNKQYVEQIVIYRVEYDDSSVWQNPAK